MPLQDLVQQDAIDKAARREAEMPAARFGRRVPDAVPLCGDIEIPVL
jgi:hypothetical protein